MIREIRRLLMFSGYGKQFFLLLLLRVPFDGGMTVANTLLLQNAFIAVSASEQRRLLSVCLVFAFTMLFLFLYNGTIWSIYAPFVTRLEGRLRSKLFSKIAALPLERVERAPSGDLITRLNTDVQLPFSQPIHLPHLACSTLNILVSSGILLAMNPQIFGLVLLFVVPHILFSQIFIARAMPRLVRKSIEATAENTHSLSAFVTCADVSQIYDAGGYLMDKLQESSRKILKANMRIKRKNALSAAILPLFGMVGYLAILVFCAEWISTGVLSFGDLVGAFQLRGGILLGSMMFINSIVNISSSLAGIQRINALLSEESSE